MIDAKTIRQDFPIFKRRIHGKPIIYLDSTATALKPKQVIHAVNSYYTRSTANVFRGIYTLSEEATSQYENARNLVAQFIGAGGPEEIIFTRNTSESINSVAYILFLSKVISHGDEVVATIMEHHSNFVPWQQLSQKFNAKFTIWNINAEGQLQIGELDKLITRRTKVLAITAVSNVLGTIVPIQRIVQQVKKLNPNCLVLVDGAQAVPHMPVNVREWGCDFLAFSGHKMLGPSGIGVLWGKKDLLNELPPFLYGGDMIREVYDKTTLFNTLPHKFEAGTPFIEGAIGLGAAVEYLSKVGMGAVRKHEEELTRFALEKLSCIEGMTVYGPYDTQIRAGVIAFRLDHVHPHDIAQVLDKDNICIRVGFHCAMPLHQYLGVSATARASFYLYTTKDDIDAFAKGLQTVKKMFL